MLLAFSISLMMPISAETEIGWESGRLGGQIFVILESDGGKSSNPRPRRLQSSAALLRALRSVELGAHLPVLKRTAILRRVLAAEAIGGAIKDLLQSWSGRLPGLPPWKRYLADFNARDKSAARTGAALAERAASCGKGPIIQGEFTSRSRRQSDASLQD
jgi:hypothetical protein